MEQLKLTQEWDKVFPKNDKVEHKKGDLPQPIRHHAGCRRVRA